MRKLMLFFIPVFIFTSCDSVISTVRERDIINNSSHTAQFTLTSYGDKVFTLAAAERMTLKLPSFPAGKIISDVPVVFKTHAENATIEDMPTYELNINNTFTHQITVKIKNDRFAVPQSITITPSASHIIHTRITPTDVQFDFTCDVGGYRYENYFNESDKKYYLKIY
ncbi:hypothetical protein [Treponema sp. Marseille-Q4130]|uniref:hypothetical protein n=1 Tax=Treponema sp. Marseille-Q4130 TaxID=2766702 RepID=UPI001651B490|nr:hypothetical protein [Treponema sp. Marseille-Q4130]MBC6720987.1 hypothetical protein [Treponema sp. Marseille-Q4130]